MKKLLLLLLPTLLITARLQAQLPDSTEVDYQLNNFKFVSGETLPELKLHYTTFGKPVKNAKGQVVNAVYIMHGTTGNSHNFTNRLFAGNLFQTSAVQDGNVAALVGDQPRLLQGAGGHGHAGPAHAEHNGKEFLGEMKMIVPDPVVHMEKPPCQPLL